MKPSLALVLLALLAAALACNIPGTTTAPTADVSALVAQTQTAIAVAQALTPAVVTPQAGQQPLAPAVSPSAPAGAVTPAGVTPPATIPITPLAPQCLDKAFFVSETIPDNTPVAPNDAFMKTWTLQNVGTCAWTPSYELVFIDGEQMGGTSPAPIGQNVPPNGTLQIYLPQTAPAAAGLHQGRWMLRNNLTSKAFGLGDNADVAFWVKINVVPGAAPATPPGQAAGAPTLVYTFDDKISPFYIGSDTDISFDLHNGDLRLTAFESAGDQWRVAERSFLDNFIIEADFLTGPNCAGRDDYGLLIRAPSQPDNVIDTGYVFGFSCEGQYRIYRMDSGKYTGLVTWTPNSAIRTGPNQSNRMTVKATGDQFQFSANGTLLFQLGDPTYTGGLYGLMVASGGTKNFQVAVQQIAIWDLP